jgi:hypothetical protein
MDMTRTTFVHQHVESRKVVLSSYQTGENDRKELGTVGGNSTGDEKDCLSRFKEGSADNEYQGVKELIGETYVHPISTPIASVQ